MIISTPAPNPAPQHCNYILILKEKNYTDERLKKATHLRAVDKVNNQLMCQWGGGGDDLLIMGLIFAPQPAVLRSRSFFDRLRLQVLFFHRLRLLFI